MKLYPKQVKTARGWGYWGDAGEIEVGMSCGYVATPGDFQSDQPHYHKQGTVYILTLSGTGVLRVGSEEVEHTKDTLLRIDPGEIYQHLRPIQTPLSWVTFCTTKDPKDKISIVQNPD